MRKKSLGRVFVLTYFIFGILFYGYLIPLLEAWVAYCTNLISVKNTQALLKIAKLEAEIDKLEAEDDTRVIGFSVEPDVEDDEDE